MLSWFQLSPMEWDAIHLSMSVALSSMLWSLPFAIFIAWLLARKEFYGKSLITGIIHLPLVLPPVVIGYLLLVAMGRNGFIGKYLYQWFGVSFGFSWKGAVLASAVVALQLLASRYGKTSSPKSGHFSLHLMHHDLTSKFDF